MGSSNLREEAGQSIQSKDFYYLAGRMDNKKIAVLDLGTNTFHLLIAEHSDNSFKILYKEKLPVKLGQGGITKGVIAPDAYQRAIDTIGHFKKVIDRYDVTATFATGTSALRNAQNSDQLVEEIKEEYNIHIDIISGDKEAQLIYEGVKSALDLGKNTSMIMDIGGGSVEFIICNKAEVLWKKSFEIGAQRLLDGFKPFDPIKQDEISKLKNYFEEKLGELSKAVNKFKPDTLVGSSGTFDTLAEIDFLKKGHKQPEIPGKEYTLTPEEFNFIYHDLLSKNRDERLKIPGMIELRVDMIVVACVMIDYIISTYRIPKLRVSTYALKEGVLQSVFKFGKIV
ncbi:MAG: phosphatase [Cytophagaceae bacterium]